MGLFSSRKKTYVSSVVYNLAGPIEDRPDYLKTLVLSNILITRKRLLMGKVIQSGYESGMGLRLRGYHRWARTNFKQVGIPTDRFYGKRDFNPQFVAAAMASDFSIIASIDWIDSGPAEIEMWGRQWMREYMPLKEQTDTWSVDFIEATKEVLINFTDTTPPVVFKPSGYRDGGDYLYVSYSRPLTVNRWTTPLLFIYARNTGSAALDALFLTAQTTGEYLPYIPIRHESEFISETYKPEVYKEAKKAYKKAVGQKFDDLVDKIKDNASLSEIDFAYIFFGVGYNTKDMASRRYMYKYFRHLLSNQLQGPAAYNGWINAQPTVTEAVTQWLLWYAVQHSNPAGSPQTEPAPSRDTLTAAPGNSVIIEDKGPGKSNLKMEITWNSMFLSSGTGLGKVGAKKGDVWFTFVGGQTIVASAYTNDEVENLTIDTVEAWHQVSDVLYEKITIVGMTHINHIYNGKSVETTAAQALVDTDDSGFLIPIHYDIFREMSLVDATQMSTQCVNIVFNSYAIVKKKWYQRGWFRVLLIIAIVILTVLYPPAGVAAGSGILGTGAAVGAILGFTGLAAVIAGAIANMIAAMIITQLITYVSVKLLGEKIGLIVAAIAAFMALQIGTALQAGQNMASIWSNMMNATNLLQLTNAVGNGYAGLLRADTMEIMQRGENMMDDYRRQSLDLQEQYAEQFGYGTAVFNPMELTEAGESFFTEPSETFLSRTLLTGSEIAQMSNNLITNFVELTLHNPYSEE